jgi:hypothetical protein
VFGTKADTLLDKLIKYEINDMRNWYHHSYIKKNQNFASARYQFNWLFTKALDVNLARPDNDVELGQKLDNFNLLLNYLNAPEMLE